MLTYYKHLKILNINVLKGKVLEMRFKKSD